MFKAFKYRIYPTRSQEEFLMKSFGCARFIYNYGLEQKNNYFTENGKSLNFFKLQNTLPELKSKYPWLKDVNSQALQMSLRNLEVAFTRFFHKQNGYPNFKSRHSNLSFQLPQGIKLVGNKLFIPKVKSPIKIVVHRPIPIDGIVKNSTISKNHSGQYFISFLVELDDNYPTTEYFDPNKTIGIDLGIKTYATLSNGEVVSNPKFLNKSLAKLKLSQQKLSLKKKGSNNFKKQKLLVARLHNKISNQRSNFLNQLTHKLTHENQISTLCIEDLKVNELLSKNDSLLSRYISDAGWREFRRQLEYKSLWYGKRLIVIDQYNPSSKMCSSCGSINSELQLSDRTWKCSNCNTIHDRDLNASVNIKNFAIEICRRNYGQSLSESNKLVTEVGSSVL